MMLHHKTIEYMRPNIVFVYMLGVLEPGLGRHSTLSECGILTSGEQVLAILYTTHTGSIHKCRLEVCSDGSGQMLIDCDLRSIRL